MRFELLDDVVAIRGLNRGVKGQVIALACDRDGKLVEVTTLHTDGPISYTCINLPDTLVRIVDDQYPRRPGPTPKPAPGVPKYTPKKVDANTILRDVLIGWALIMIMLVLSACAFYFGS